MMIAGCVFAVAEGSLPMRFSIRDLLLVTVIVALAAGWWIDQERQKRYCGAVERLLKSAEEEREQALHDRESTLSLTLALMKDLDVIHPGWRRTKWADIPKPIQLDTDARKLKKRGKAWAEFQELKARIDAGEKLIVEDKVLPNSSAPARNPPKP